MTAANNPPFTGQDWDDALEDRHDVARLVVRGLGRAQTWILIHATTVNLDETAIASLHRMVFENVFPDFAGRFRGPSPTFIAYNVTFGNRRGLPHDDVPPEMEVLGRTSVNLIHQLDKLSLDMIEDDFHVEVVKAAAYIHCRFVEIHPFVNGNGRTSRLCINYFLQRYGLPQLVIQRTSDPEYIDAIRTWIDQRSVDHFVQFLLSQINQE